jgi:clan AA aspartic protease (TIGR02281 family)
MGRRWPHHAAAASALFLAAASPAAASDIGSFLGAVGGMLSQGVQPHYYQYQQPQYYQQPQQYYYQSPTYQRRYSGSSAAARRKAQAEAEAKKKQEEAEKQKKEQEAAAAAAVSAPTTTNASGDVDVAMTRKSGNLWVPAKINNVVTIDFVIDSGASDITLPRDVYLTLIRSGTLTKANYIGGANFGIADGSEVKGLKFKLASLQVGNQVLNDVVASVMPSDSATPLLGLSFLSRFQSWSIDNKSGTLKLMPTAAKPAAGATQTAAASVQPLPEPPDPGQPASAATATDAPLATAVPQAPAASPAPVTSAAATGTRVAAAAPRSGHVATSAFVVKDATVPTAPTAAATAPIVHAAVPAFPANTSYANARSSLLALGYGPAPLPAGSKCDSTTDATCFPERSVCTKSDAIHCDYLWRRGDALIKVETVAVPPTVAAVECQVNCKQ